MDLFGKRPRRAPRKLCSTVTDMGLFDYVAHPKSGCRAVCCRCPRCGHEPDHGHGPGWVAEADFRAGVECGVCS